MNKNPDSNRDTDDVEPEHGSAPKTPRWVKISGGIIIIALILVVVSQNAQTVRSAWIAMELTGWFAIVPLSIASVITGLIMALGTPWGLFRHYWVIFKLLLTLISTIVLLLNMQSVSLLAGIAAKLDNSKLGELPSQLLHPAVGLLVLIVITLLSVYKPRGMTPYGWRKHQEKRKEQQQ